MSSVTSVQLRNPAVDEAIHAAAAPTPPFALRGCRIYKWNREAILANAPQRPGVYGLFNALWIYIGDASDIRARLLEHEAGDNPCIAHYRPSGFAYELVDDDDRSERRDEIAAQLEPLCDGRSLINRHNGVHKHHDG
jgi:hypothetical protein